MRAHMQGRHKPQRPESTPQRVRRCVQRRPAAIVRSLDPHAEPPAREPPQSQRVARSARGGESRRGGRCERGADGDGQRRQRRARAVRRGHERLRGVARAERRPDDHGRGTALDREPQWQRRAGGHVQTHEPPHLKVAKATRAAARGRHRDYHHKRGRERELV